MNFFFGEKAEQSKKMTNEISAKIRQATKSQFCQFCQKSPATKIAFAVDSKNGFTCNNCELKAVGGDVKNLSEKSLISIDKFADILARNLISHQAANFQPCEQVKQTSNSAKAILKTATEVGDLIKSEFNILKKQSDTKMGELLSQSQKQNSVFVFEELNRILKQKKPSLEEVKDLTSKRALVDKKGLHFIHEDAIEASKAQIDERYSDLKKQTKVKLKEIDELSEWINAIEL